MAVRLFREGKGSGEEEYSYIHPYIDKITEEPLKSKKIFLTKQELEIIKEKYSTKSDSPNYDDSLFIMNFCNNQILGLINTLGYFLSTNDDLMKIHCLKGFNKNNTKAFSKVEMDYVDDLEKELEMINEELDFLNGIFEDIIERIRKNGRIS